MIVAGTRPTERSRFDQSRCNGAPAATNKYHTRAGNLAVLSCDTTDHHGKREGAATHPPSPRTQQRSEDDPSPHQPQPQQQPPQPRLDMRRERDRLETFVSWPLTFIDKERLARTGFYYYGDSDKVRCHFCRVEVGNWEEGDDPAVDHERWSPLCPVLRGRAYTNVPITSANSASPPRNDAPFTPGRDECGALAGNPDGPQKPAYALESARLQSFADWPCRMKQTPEAMADAGFFYTGSGDKTICYYCGGGLKDWEDDDDPWEQHARWFPSCHYIRTVKGDDYVRTVNADVPSERAFDSSSGDRSKSPAAATAAEQLANCTVARKSPVAPAAAADASTCREESKNDADLCKLCFTGEKNICFVPCGHVVACPKCALSLQICPVCRKQFTSTMRLYYS